MKQIASQIYLANMEIMKGVLDLIAFKTGSKSTDYKYYKKEIMNSFYRKLNKLFKQLSEENLIVKCPNKCKIRQGFQKCTCSGSGWIDKK